MAAPKPIVVFVLGNPGAGKGTQCSLIVEKYGFKHLSAGELLREERKKPESEHGKLIDSYMRDGRIVPVEITIKLIENAMRAPGGGNKFLVDGFPRNADNLDGWERHMKDKADVRAVLYIDAPPEVCWERVQKRSAQASRPDDSRDTFLKRLESNRNDTMPIVEKFKKLGLVKEISGVAVPDEVFLEVQKHVEEACL